MPLLCDAREKAATAALSSSQQVGTAGTPSMPRSGDARPMARWLRAQYNRFLILLCLLVALPVVIGAEYWRHGAGRRVARRWIKSTGRLCGVTFRVRGTEQLEATGNYVLVPNHTSLLDVPALLIACEEVQFLATAGLFHIPLLAQAMRAIGTESIDRHDPARARRQLDKLATVEGPRHLAVFAQGGIVPANERLQFKTGAFVLALKTGACVVPVAIHHTAELLPPRALFGVRPGTIVVELLVPVATDGLDLEQHRRLRDQVQAAVQRRLDEEPKMARR